MASYQKFIALGNLTRDIEIQYLQSGTAVGKSGMAVNERYKNKSGEWVDSACFFDLTFWGKTAEIASEYLSKGSPLLIEGKLKLEEWEKDGQKRSKLSVTVENMQMLGKKDDSKPTGKPQRQPAQQQDDPAF